MQSQVSNNKNIHNIQTSILCSMCLAVHRANNAWIQKSSAHPHYATPIPFHFSNKPPKLVTPSPIPVPTNTSNDKPYSSFFVSLSSAYSIHDPSKTAQLPSIIPLVPTYPAAVPANASQTAPHTPTVHNRSYVSPLRPTTHLKIIFSGSPMITPCFSKIARSSVGLRIM